MVTPLYLQEKEEPTNYELLLSALGPLIKRPRIEEAAKDEKMKEVAKGRKKLSKSRTKEDLSEAESESGDSVIDVEHESGDGVSDVESEGDDGVSDVESEAGDDVSDVESEVGEGARDPFKVHFEEDLTEQEVETLEKVLSVPLDYSQTEVCQRQLDSSVVDVVCLCTVIDFRPIGFCMCVHVPNL